MKRPSLLPAALLLAAGAAWAEADSYPEVIEVPDAPDESPAVSAAATQLPVIRVSGDRLQRSLQDSDSSAAIASAEQLESAASMKDAASLFGNVISAAGDRELSIRGVPQGGIGGEGETISVLLDGLALPERAAGFAGPTSAWDLQQLEVLRGAQSTAQGRNSLAGMVVLQAREPTPYPELRTRVGVLSRDSHDLALAGGGPLSGDLAWRIAAQDRRDRGDIRNVTREESDAGREVSRNGRFKLAWEPGADYRALLHLSAARQDRGDTLHVLSDGRLRTERSDVRYEDSTRSRLAGLNQSLALGGAWRLESISGFARSRAFLVIDQGRTEEDRGYSDNLQNEDLLSQELRLHFEGQAWQWVTGLYLADSRRLLWTQGYDIVAGGGAALLNGRIDADGQVRTGALFGEADWSFAEAWRLSLGARLNHERLQRHDRSDITIALTAPLPGVDLPLAVPLPDETVNLLATVYPDAIPRNYAVAGDRRFTDLLPRLGLSWQIGRHWRLAGLYSEGYRSGGTSVAFFSGQVSEFAPEYTRSGELVLRGLLPARGRLSLNAFYTDWQDQQVLIGESTGFTTVTTNAGRSHSLGAELELSWPLGRHLGLRLSGGWMNTQFDAFLNQGEDYAGNRFPYAPRHSGSIGLDLRRLGPFSGQISLQHVGAYYSDPANTPDTRVAARRLLHLRLDWQLLPAWRLSLWGRNLTGDDNIQGRFIRDDTEVHRYGEARSLGLLLEYAR